MGKYDKLLEDYERHCQSIAKIAAAKDENPADKQKRIKNLEKDYGKWFAYYFPNYAKSPCAWFHIKAAKLLINNPVIYLLLEWFRGAAKSVHVCMGIPLFLMVKGELQYMLLIGENEDKACTLLSDIQAQLQYNPRFIQDYGEQFSYGNWADGDFKTKQGVKFKALGLGQSPRGVREEANRPDYIVCDDLDTKKRCNNPRLIREAVEWIMEDLWGCFAGVGNMRFVLANNLIHKNSILANLKKAFKEANEQAKLQDLKKAHYHMKVNLVDEKGEPSWIERFTKKACDILFASRPYRSSQREYMNNPIEDGTIFKQEYIQYKKMLPLHQYDALAIYGDLSYKEQGDFKAIKFWGRVGREFHRISCLVRQTSRRNCAIWLYDLYEKLKLSKYNISYKIEGLFAMDEFVHDFDKEGDERGYYIPVVADKRNKADKYDRIESISGYWERRNVWYNEEEKDSTDSIQDIDQLLAFEKGSGAPDDSPDADHGALKELERKTYQENFPPRIGKRKARSGSY